MYSITRRLATLVATMVVVLAVTSCAESSRPTATGKGNIRGINAISTSPEVAFLIEERRLELLNFKQSSNYSPFDDLTYKFNFDAFLPGQAQPTRLTSQRVDVEPDREYTVILTGTIANPSSMFWDDPIREWESTETVSEIIFAHLAPSVGEVDIYFAAPGTVPVRDERVGTLSNGNRLPGMDFDETAFEMIVTPKNDPGTFIYQSAAINLSAQTRVLFAIFDGDPTLPGNVGVNFVIDTGFSTSLPDIRFPPQLRMLHTAFGTDNFDGYFDGDFATKIFSDIGFKDLSPYAGVFEAESTLTLTQVDNIGATIHEQEVVVAVNTNRTIVLAGAPGELSFITLLDSARPVETFSSVRFLNTSVNTDRLDIYVLQPDTPIDDDAFPRIQGIPSGFDTGVIDFGQEMREVTITLADDKAPISTPVILDLDFGDVIDVVIVDTVDPNIVETMVIENHSLP